MDRADEDFLTLMVLNHIVGGGGFTAILKDEVREKRGLTYSIGSYPASRDLAQQWLGQFSSTNEVVGEAIDVTRTIWAEVAENGPTDEQVTQAITYLTGAYPLRFDGNARIAGILVGMQLQDLPIDYIPGRNDRVRAITADDVRELASELMDVADDIRAAARRFGFQRRYDQHPVDNIEDPRVAVSGLANAFLNLDDLPTADARAVMNVQLRKHLDLDATAAQEIEILGQWLVTECGSAQQAIPRMSKRLNRLDQSGQNFDALMAVIQTQQLTTV